MTFKHTQTLWLEMKLKRETRNDFFSTKAWTVLKVIICGYFALSTVILGRSDSFQGYPTWLLLLTQVVLVGWSHMAYWRYVFKHTSERVDILAYFGMFMAKGAVFVWYALVGATVLTFVANNDWRTMVAAFAWCWVGCLAVWLAKEVYEKMLGNQGALAEFIQRMKHKQKYHPIWEIIRL